MPLAPRTLPFHYGWLIVAAGSLGIFACIGLARFALGMLLPAMGQDLHLSYAQMGTISTSNFLGYLAGILAASHLVRRFGARALTAAALLLSGLSMVGIGCVSSLYSIVVLYILTGVGSALANIPIMAMLSTWFSSKLRGKAAGLVVSGNGAAIVFSGLAVPWMNSLSVYNWRLSWVALGALVVLIAFVCLLTLRNRPQDLGLFAAGQEPQAAGGQPHQLNRERSVPLRLILHLGALYFVFGFTFVAYATFIVTTMVQQYGFSQQTAGSFWSWVGFFSLFSGPLFGALADRVSRRFALATVFAIQTLAYLLVGLQLSVPFLYLSIGCFGIVAWSIPSIMAALAGDYAGPDKTFALFSAVTFIFAVGQVAGPFLAGLVAEHTGDFSGSYLLAAALTAMAAALALLLPKPIGPHRQ
ncbi:MFS transporter [Desulfobulbus sp.]|uniref:MFS transporter n=1 Tax=Desulfobulbus sp. TaxID=895 RepID=UPI0027BA0EC8|nr:MFS transporter [Desulfobulbus sp.]